MATQSNSGLIHDQNSSFLHKGAAFVAKKKAGVAGRRALGDLTNTANNPSKSLSVLGDRLSTSKPTGSTFKIQERTWYGGRKALSNLSNSGKPNLTEAPKKNLNDKLNAVAEVFEHEGFLHNHEECIKAHQMGMNTELKELEEWPPLFVEDLYSSLDRQPSKLRCPPRSPASPIPDTEWYRQEPDLDFTLIEMP